jgi:hypothetical protein
VILKHPAGFPLVARRDANPTRFVPFVSFAILLELPL